MKIAHFASCDTRKIGHLLRATVFEHQLTNCGHEVVHVSPVGAATGLSDSISSVSTAEFFQREWRSCDGFIVGGGEIIQSAPAVTHDYTRDGETACLAYPGLWLAPAIAARGRNVPLMWNAPGVSTELHPDHYAAIRDCLSESPYLAVRDSASRDLLQSVVSDINIAVVPDSAFGLPGLWPKEMLRPIFQKYMQKRGHGKSDRFYVFHVNDRYLSKGLGQVAEGISALCKRDRAIPVILPIGPVHDEKLARQLVRQLTVPHLLVDRIDSLQEVAALLACADLYCGSSLHGLIVSGAYQTPGIAVADRSVHKFTGFAEQLGIEQAIVYDWRSGLRLCADGRIPSPTDAAYAAARAALHGHWTRLIAALEPGQPATPVHCNPLEETFRIVVSGALDVLTSRAVRKLDSERTLSLKLAEATDAVTTASEVLEDIGPEIEAVTSQLCAQIDLVNHSRAWQLVKSLRHVMGRSDNPMDSLRKSVDDLRSLTARVSVCAAMMDAFQELQPELRIEDWTASVVVCVHNAPEDVAACLQSVEKHTDLDRYQLILIDDGSDPETEAIVRAAAERLGATRIRNDAPRGYTCAANQGLQHARTDARVLLNSDTIVTSGWLDGLLRCAQSRDNVACVGPLSNAASWQSIPHLTGDDGRWKVNSVPAGLTIDQFAEVLASASPRLYPSTPLVNGFCYLITRQAIDTVGFLDEAAFPRGYGEEDDYSLRCQSAGFCHLIADDVYVFHAKSKSFTSAVRDQLVKKSRAKLVDKHGESHLGGAVAAMKSNEALLISRVSARLAAPSKIRSSPVYQQSCRIGWVLPGPAQPDGARCAVELTNRLAAAGHLTRIIAPDPSLPNYSSLQGVVSLADARGEQFDIVICTDPSGALSAESVTAGQRVHYHVSRYFEHHEPSEAIKAFYLNHSAILHVATSRGLADFVQERVGADVRRVLSGGIDHRQFRPVRTPQDHQVVMFGSQRRIQGTSEIFDAIGSRATLNLTSPGLRKAENICGGRVFVSACWHEGFNFGPLEAMACGVPVVMTLDDFTPAYARHAENAWVVPAHDVAGLQKGIETVLSDSRLRMKLIEEGLETAAAFDWNAAADEFSHFVDSIGQVKLPIPAAA